MRVKAKVGFNIDGEDLRVEPGETADLPTALAEQWAEQGIVELLKSPSYNSKKDDPNRPWSKAKTREDAEAAQNFTDDEQEDDE